MEKPVRKAVLNLTYNSADITADVTPYLLSFDYTDTAKSDETDELVVVFEDKDALWKTGWFPKRGAKLAATLTCHDWPGGKTLDCGSFEIDKIQFTGPPNTCTIKALALGITSSIRREKITKAWENYYLRDIAQQVTSRHGFELHYDSAVNPKIERFDQREQSDIDLLLELCKNNGLGLKATDGKVVIFEEKLFDEQAPSYTFTRDADGYISHNIEANTADIYSACEVKYLDPKQKILVSYRHVPGASEWSQEKPPSGYTLKIDQRCTCQADAERLAKSKLREANKREATGNIDSLGDPEIHSGKTSSLKNYGKFDEGKFFIDRVRNHYDKSGGYTSDADIRGTVDY